MNWTIGGIGCTSLMVAAWFVDFYRPAAALFFALAAFCGGYIARQVEEGT